MNILRLQRIEVGQAVAEIKTSDGTFPAGSYVIKRDQPYGRLAKNLLEKQSYPDPELRTYDDSGWTMGLAMLVEVKEIKDKAILDVQTTPVETVAAKGKVSRDRQRRSRGRALRLEQHDRLPLQAAERADEGRRQGVQRRRDRVSGRVVRDCAAGRSRRRARGRRAARSHGRVAVRRFRRSRCTTRTRRGSRSTPPGRATTRRRSAGCGYTFDKFGIPYDLIYKERVRKGNLRADYDVIVMPTQTAGAPGRVPAARRAAGAVREERRSTSSSACTASRPTSPGAWAAKGSTRLRSSSTPAARSSRWATPCGSRPSSGLPARSTRPASTSRDFYAPRPLVNAEILHLEHPVFYGYSGAGPCRSSISAVRC